MKIKEQLRGIRRGLAIPTAIASAILAFDLAYLGILTTLRMPIEYAQKKLFNETKQSYRATLKDLGDYQLAQTKGFLLYGDFETEDGETRRVHDGARVLEGKLLDNSRMPSEKEIGKQYEITTIGSEKTCYTILNAGEIKWRI